MLPFTSQCFILFNDALLLFSSGPLRCIPSPKLFSLLYLWVLLLDVCKLLICSRGTTLPVLVLLVCFISFLMTPICSINQIFCMINPTTILVVLILRFTVSIKLKPLDLPCLILLLVVLIELILVLSTKCSSKWLTISNIMLVTGDSVPSQAWKGIHRQRLCNTLQDKPRMRPRVIGTIPIQWWLRRGVELGLGDCVQRTPGCTSLPVLLRRCHLPPFFPIQSPPLTPSLLWSLWTKLKCLSHILLIQMFTYCACWCTGALWFPWLLSMGWGLKSHMVRFGEHYREYWTDSQDLMVIHCKGYPIGAHTLADWQLSDTHCEVNFWGNWVGHSSSNFLYIKGMICTPNLTHTPQVLTVHLKLQSYPKPELHTCDVLKSLQRWE